MTKHFFNNQEEMPVAPANEQSTGTRFAKLYGRKPKRLALLIGIPLIAVIAATYYFFKIIKAPKAYDAQTTAAQMLQNFAAHANTYLDLEQIIVNLAPTSAKQNYLKLTLTLQFASPIETKAAHTKLPVIIDSLQTFLRELRVTDLNGSYGIFYLKEELMKRINTVTWPVVVKNILIKDMLVN